MFDRATLNEQFESLLAKQHQILAGYEELASSSSNADLKQKIEELRRDQLRHILLTERLLEIVN